MGSRFRAAYSLALCLTPLVIVCALRALAGTTVPHIRSYLDAEAYPSTIPTAIIPDDQVASVVGFASCNKHDRDQSYWANVERRLSRDHTRLADSFVWLGDVVYADEVRDGAWRPSPPDAMRAKYNTFADSGNYSGFRRWVAGEISGVWDDHDMGINDGGREYHQRDVAQGIYLDFLGAALDDVRRKRHGVYSLLLVPFAQPVPHSSSALSQYSYATCVVLLDARSSRDAVGTNGDMLGEEQWHWLGKVFEGTADEFGPNATDASLFDRCAFTLLASGVQITADEKPTEHWGNFPSSRQRLLELLHVHNARRFAFLSGDVHYADVQQVSLPGFPRPVTEVTSSGLTHSLGDIMDDWMFDKLNSNARRVGRYLGRSFGSVTIWNHESPKATISVHEAATGSPVLEVTVSLTDWPSVHPNPRNAARCGVLCEIPVQAALSKQFFNALDLYWPFGAVDTITRHKLLESGARLTRTVVHQLACRFE
jgi:alkaline phosphatase D